MKIPKTILQEQYLIPVKIVTVYVVWKIFHHFASIPGTGLNNFWIHFVFRLGSLYATVTSSILSICGMKAVGEGININLLASGKQIWVQDHCLAIPAMIVFTGSVIFFKGSVRDKTRFLITGLAGIVLINILRLALVSVAWVYLSENYFKINHSLIYVIVMYGFIFYMIARWMNRTIEKA